MRKLIVAFFFVPLSLSAQTTFLGYDEFMRQVTEHHPMVRQASLYLDQGDANLLQAKAGFEPKASVENSSKNFKDARYYDHLQGKLKVPTWFGIQLEGGFNQNDGVFLDPEDFTPNEGLWHAGISVPLGQGLFIDERRLELKKAKIYQGATEQMRRLLLNELIYEAGSAYWSWYEAQEILKIFANAVVVAQQRRNAVVRGALLGDRANVDTLEAGIQVQNRQLGAQAARIELQKAVAQLQNFLWSEGWIPLEIEEGVEARLGWSRDSINPLFLETRIRELTQQHPSLRISQYEIDGLEVDQRWKREQLKPNLDLKYNALRSGAADGFGFNTEDYTFGLAFEMPLLLRKERAGVQLNSIKIQDKQLGLADKWNQLKNKAEFSMNEWRITGDQINLYTRTVRDYLGLLNAERTKFDGGESSLFLVNRRELGYINAQLKLVELQAKNRISNLKFGRDLGTLAN